jgi:hypothetical protein
MPFADEYDEGPRRGRHGWLIMLPLLVAVVWLLEMLIMGQ